MPKPLNREFVHGFSRADRGLRLSIGATEGCRFPHDGGRRCERMTPTGGDRPGVLGRVLALAPGGNTRPPGGRARLAT